MKRSREKQTLIPAFDPVDLARELESELGAAGAAGDGQHPTAPPPFDPSSYARIVDAKISVATARGSRAPASGTRESLHTMPAPDSTQSEVVVGRDIETDAETIGRAMYGSYLESNFPEALVLAERVLAVQPDHSLAQLVRAQCRSILGSIPAPPLKPSSVVRLRRPIDEDSGLLLDHTSMFVLGHVDGVADAETVARLSGLPRAEALDRLHALVDLGLVEVVSA